MHRKIIIVAVECIEKLFLSLPVNLQSVIYPYLQEKRKKEEERNKFEKHFH